MGLTISSVYTEPGVYIKIQDVVIPAAPAGLLIPAVIGTGKKTITIVETVKKGVNNGQDILLKTPVIDLVSIIDKNQTTYIKGVDYQLTSDKVDWSLGGAEPATGLDYYVTYTYLKGTSDYKPMLLSRLDDIITEFGPVDIASELDYGTTSSATSSTLVDSTKAWVVNAYQYMYVKITGGVGIGQERLIKSNTATALTIAPNWDTTPDVTSTYSITDISENTLSIGASITLNNGASMVLCTQSIDDVYTQYKASLDGLKNQTCYVVLIMKGLATGNPLIADIKTHIDLMSQPVERRNRISILGAPLNTTSFGDYVTVASGLSDSRVGYLAPSNWGMIFGSTEYIFDGSYGAAAIAGIITNPLYTSGEPISGKILSGFSSITDNFTRTEKNQMAAQGVMVVENKNGLFKIRHALSTDNSSAVTQEIKVTRIKDVLSDLIIRNLESAYINTRNVGNETLANISATISLLLQRTILSKDIVAFQNLGVVQNLVEPRQIDVSFQIKPVWDINWILVQFGVSI